MAIGLVRRGKLSRLGSIHLRGVHLVFLAIAVQFLIFPTPWWDRPLFPWGRGVLHVGSYGLVVAFLILNRRMPALWAIASGIAMNLAVISANNGHMPSRVESLRASGQTGIAGNLVSSPDQTWGNIVAMGESTRLDFLGDWLWVPIWIPLGGAFSPGDLTLLVAVAWLIQGVMVKIESREKGGRD